MSLESFISVVLALLLAPGPTNTLMGLAGAQRGLRGVVRLLPAELLGYLTAILPLVYLGAELLGRWPEAAVLLKVAAALWVMCLAVKLWGQRSGSDESKDVTAWTVYLTTMLNPKALVFGLVLLPAPAASDFLPKLGLFCFMVVAVAMVWGTAGTLTQMGNGRIDRLRLLKRTASVWLAVVSVTLIANVIWA